MQVVQSISILRPLTLWVLRVDSERFFESWLAVTGKRAGSWSVLLVRRRCQSWFEMWLKSHLVTKGKGKVHKSVVRRHLKWYTVILKDQLLVMKAVNEVSWFNQPLHVTINYSTLSSMMKENCRTNERIVGLCLSSNYLSSYNRSKRSRNQPVN